MKALCKGVDFNRFINKKEARQNLGLGGDKMSEVRRRNLATRVFFFSVWNN